MNDTNNMTSMTKTNENESESATDTINIAQDSQCAIYDWHDQ